MDLLHAALFPDAPIRGSSQPFKFWIFIKNNRSKIISATLSLILLIILALHLFWKKHEQNTFNNAITHPENQLISLDMHHPYPEPFIDKQTLAVSKKVTQKTVPKKYAPKGQKYRPPTNHNKAHKSKDSPQDSSNMLIRVHTKSSIMPGPIGNANHVTSHLSQAQLHKLLARSPKQVKLHTALGNFYMRQQNWRAAQTAFFNAYRLMPEHPDHLFNLAVSLDHLALPIQAEQFYTKALLAAQKTPAHFKKSAIEERLKQFQKAFD